MRTSFVEILLLGIISRFKCKYRVRREGIRPGFAPPGFFNNSFIIFTMNSCSLFKFISHGLFYHFDFINYIPSFRTKVGSNLNENIVPV